MEDHRKLSDSEFEKQFQECSLDPVLFTHEAHLRLAWIHINKYGIVKAKKNIEEQIRRFVIHAGAENKYHQTITIAGVHAVNHFKKKSEANKFDEFIVHNAQLITKFKHLINSHYSYDVFKSQRAKNEYLEPDLQPFEDE